MTIPCLHPTAPGGKHSRSCSSGGSSQQGRGDLSITEYPELGGILRHHRAQLLSSGSFLQGGEFALSQRMQLWAVLAQFLLTCEAPGASRRCHQPCAVSWLLLGEGDSAALLTSVPWGCQGWSSHILEAFLAEMDLAKASLTPALRLCWGKNCVQSSRLCWSNQEKRPVLPWTHPQMMILIILSHSCESGMWSVHLQHQLHLPFVVLVPVGFNP